MKLFIIIIGLSVITGTFANNKKDTIYVKKDGIAFIGRNNHHSWATATNNIQAAIYSLDSIGGGQIWIAKGTYYPTDTIPGTKSFNFKGKDSIRLTSFILKNNIKLIGSFNATETHIEEREYADLNSDGKIDIWELKNSTILSGNVNNSQDSTDNSFHVVYGLGSNNLNILDGFIIKHGYANNNHYDILREGAGAYNIAIYNSVISNNYSLNYGGGAYLCEIKNCLITKNVSNYGGGGISDCNSYQSKFVFNSAKFGGATYRSNVTECLVLSNKAETGGGSIFGKISKSKYYNNYASLSSGGIGSASVINCLIANNKAIKEGGGIEECNTYNSTICNNYAPSGGGISDGYTINCIIWGNNNQATDDLWTHISNSAIQDGFYGNNIKLSLTNSDGPKFKNPSDSIGTVTSSNGLNYILNSDWSLQANSPCIDTSEMELSLIASHFDLNENPRLKGRKIDLGAYEFQSYDFVGLNASQDSIIYVTVNGTGDGSSWENATNNPAFSVFIAPLINAKQVWVSKGTYKPSKTNNVNASFYPKNNVLVYGGFKGNETNINEREKSDLNQDGLISPWEFNNITVLSGNIGNLADSVDNSYRILSALNADSTSNWNGFTIRSSVPGGKHAVDGCFLSNSIISNNYSGGLINSFINNCLIANNSNNFYGSGAGAYKSNLKNCYIQNNRASEDGGGAYQCELYNCSVSYNSADYGGGCYDSKLYNCLVFNNQATYYGGGCYGGKIELSKIYKNSVGSFNEYGGGGCFWSEITNSSIYENYSYSNGGGLSECKAYNCIIYNNSAWLLSKGGGAQSSRLENCKIFNNSACYGGGIYSGDAFNCIISNNDAHDDGSASYRGHLYFCTIVRNGDNAISGSLVHNSIVWGNKWNPYGEDNDPLFFNTAIFANSMSKFGDPIFMHPSDSIGIVKTSAGLTHILNADWMLQKGSPCIDKANYSRYGYNLKTDIDGNKRVINGEADQGAYETKHFIEPANKITINYYNETTNEIIPDNVKIRRDITFKDTFIYGNNKVYPLNPENKPKRYYFIFDETDTSYIASQLVVYRPIPKGAINYINESLDSINDSYQWNSNGLFENIVKNQNIKSIIPSYGEFPKTINLKIRATDTAFASTDFKKIIIPARPAPPTNGIVDDYLNTFDWDWSKDGYNSISDYEISLDRGISNRECYVKPENIGDSDIPAGNVQVWVTGSNTVKTRFKSEKLISAYPYTNSNYINIYPTITRNRVYIITINSYDYHLLNTDGRLIQSQMDNLSGLNIIDLSRFNAGIYILKIKTHSLKSDIRTFKIMKLK
jgi:hypothetical protein